MLDQPKIDLAVLYKLYEHAEAGGEALTPSDLAHLFKIQIAPRRVELALEELSRRAEVEQIYHPHYSDVGLWTISRDGVRTVERAINREKSFIHRLCVNGDQWLDSEEAYDAKLEQLPRYHPDLPTPAKSNSEKSKSSASADPDWTKRGAIAAIIAIPIMILLWVLS